MIRISDIKLPLDYTDGTILRAAAKTLRVDASSITTASLFRRSIDARHKNDVHFITSIDVALSQNEQAVLNRCKYAKAALTAPYRYKMPNGRSLPQPPVVVGAGPAGLFAALILAQCGARPVVIERGRDVDARKKDVTAFWQGGPLNEDSNVQFGEGGAGTFSDGKLNTGTKDARARKVLQELVKAGAPEEILYLAKPHVGTDKLPAAVKQVRKEIIRLGGRFLFETKLTGIKSKNGAVTAALIENGQKPDRIETAHIILAIGHSARDTFSLLDQMGIALEQKPFSVGVRIEHPRSMVDSAQYGPCAGKGRLGAADYKLAVHLPQGRGVYTFCMCPGGTVVAAASEKGGVVTNGMSEFARDRQNSNSALLVGVGPKDFKSGDVLAGIDYQRSLERLSFQAGGESYAAPVQRVEDFLLNRQTQRFGDVLPSYRPAAAKYNLHKILPEEIAGSLAQGITLMNSRLRGFSHPDAVLTGVETRSSSPVRILRDPVTLQSLSLRGLYPCGEGAGYAGGIVSAAVDGIKCAEEILTNG